MFDMSGGIVCKNTIKKFLYVIMYLDRNFDHEVSFEY